MKISATPERFRLAETFTISRGSKDAAEVLTVRIAGHGAEGWGECVPYRRYGETMESVREEVLALAQTFAGLDARAASTLDLRAYLPAGAARNALDCALWDWRAKAAGRRVWELLGRPAPGPVTTAFTLSLDTPDRMREAAARQAHRPLLKIKLGTADDMARVEAVRAGAPDPRIIVDANEGWTPEIYADLAPHLVRLGVALVEQPLPADADEALAGMARPLPVCADESCHDTATLGALRGKYDMVNIKLDKTGGLTEALDLEAAARRDGFGIMVGCMVGTSLAMAPAILPAQGAEVVDLDGSLLLAEDRDAPLVHDASGLHPADATLWG